MITSYICMVLYSLQWFWNFCMSQNHLKSLVKQRWLSLIPRVSDSKGLRYDQRICISFKFQVILLMTRPPFENHWPYCIVTQHKVTWGWWGSLFPTRNNIWEDKAVYPGHKKKQSQIQSLFFRVYPAGNHLHIPTSAPSCPWRPSESPREPYNKDVAVGTLI